MNRGASRPYTDPRATASVVVAMLEGAVMLSRLYDGPAHMRRAVNYLKRHLGSLTRPRLTERCGT